MKNGFMHDRAMALHRRAWQYQQDGRTLDDFVLDFEDVDFDRLSACAVWKTTTAAREDAEATGRPVSFFFPYMRDLDAAIAGQQEQ